MSSPASESNIGQVFPFRVLQFTQMYEWVPGCRQWWIFVYR